MSIAELIERSNMYDEDIRQSRIRMNILQDSVYSNVIKITDLNFEIWKDITGYEGIYQISNLGNVKNTNTSRILKPRLNSNGYKFVTLHCNGKKKMMRIHRLIAIHYIPNDENKQCVDHIDNNRTNNKLSNLRWCTNQQNNMNQSISKNNKSGAKGVTFYKRTNKWEVKIMINGKHIHLGYFTEINDAIEARRKKAKELFGEFINNCEL
jgi:hypothetical protein